MNIVYGQPNTQNKDGTVVEVPRRCRLCTGLVQRPKLPGQLTHPDPVCPHPNLGAVGHDWLSIENPASNFFRKVILKFWADECTNYVAANPRLAGTDVSVEDLPMVKRNESKKRLDQQLRDSSSILHDSLGVAIRVQFEKPLGANQPQPQCPQPQRFAN